MTFPSRGCRTCRQRRVKCDANRPVCDRCEKANLNCAGYEENHNFVFLNENEYAIGRRNRPRGPNVKTTRLVITKKNDQVPSAGGPSGIIGDFPSLEASSAEERQNTKPKSIHPALDISIEEQALTYYSRSYIELPHELPEVVNSHLNYTFIPSYWSQPQSLLDLAIHAVSHSTFGRARTCQTALVTSSKKYSQALISMNLALKDSSRASKDDVLLAVMLLSFYEHSVTERLKSPSQDHRIQSIASRSFAHHDGAMALLRLRQQFHRHGYSDCNLELDKVVRRQLIRSLLLRSLPVPSWLRDGSKFGEQGFALELDRTMMITAKLRHQANLVLVSAEHNPISFPTNEGRSYDEKLTTYRHRLLTEAQVLDKILLHWAYNLPKEESRYSVHVISEPDDGRPTTNSSKIFDNSNIHIYPTVGHAGIWNRYRALRIAINDMILKTLFVLNSSNLDLDIGSLAYGDATTSAKLVIEQLANDLCASIPYALGLLRVSFPDVTQADEEPNIVVTVNNDLLFLKDRSASTTSFLCWPLTMITMTSGMQEAQQRYLRERLLDVSEIVDDGILERVASGLGLLSTEDS